MRLLSSHSEESLVLGTGHTAGSPTATQPAGPRLCEMKTVGKSSPVLYGMNRKGVRLLPGALQVTDAQSILNKQGVAADLASKLNILMNIEDCYTHTLIHTSHQSLYHLRTDLDPHLPPKPLSPNTDLVPHLPRKPLSPFCLYCFHTSLYLSWWFPLVTISCIYWVPTTWESMLSTIHLSFSLK